MEKLATIRYIYEIKPIENADNIEIAVIEGKDHIIRKGYFQSRQMVLHFAINSFLPIHPIFEFLKNTSYRKMGNREGFLVRPIRLRGVYSHGLVLPIKDFIKQNLLEDNYYYVGENVTTELGVTFYEPK